jgi:hypothetical protein
VGLLTDVSGNQWEQGYQALQSIQLQEVPPQPAAPVPPAADASQEDLDAHAAAEAAYAEQMNLWTAKSERIASENAEAAALAGGVMV